MSKLYRSLLWTAGLAVVAACGDDVTVQPPPPPPDPVVRSVVVTPDGATINAGASLPFSAAVTADPGLTPTVTWSTTASAAVGSISGTGVFTSLATSPTTSVGVTATATAGTSSASGSATLNIAAPQCLITSFSVSQTDVQLVEGTSYNAAASVQGTAACTAAQLGVTWSLVSSNPGGAVTVSAAGLITGNAAGTGVVRATSVTDVSKTASISVTVLAPDPATISIQSVTYVPPGGGPSVPVMVGNVFGQIEVNANVDAGGRVLDHMDVVITGPNGAQVVATHNFPPPLAPAAAAGPELAPVLISQSTNTAQVVKVGSLWRPVLLNGNSFVSLLLYVFGQPTPIASEAFPFVLNNPDAMIPLSATGTIGTLTQSPTSTTPSVLSGANTWYKSSVKWEQVNYLAFGGAAPTAFALGSALCGNSGAAAISGTPTTGISISGTWACANVEGSADYNGALPSVTTGAPPLPEVTVTAPTGWSRVTSPFTLGGQERYNLLSATTPNPAAVLTDQKGPTVTPNEIGFLAGCSGTIPNPGCWIGNLYNLIADFVATDGGSGAPNTALANTVNVYLLAGVAPVTCGVTPVTAASLADNTSPTNYDFCAIGTDPLGNNSGAVQGFNKAGKDGVAPVLAYVGTYDPGAGTVNPAVSDVVPGTVLDYTLVDDNSGLDGGDNVSIKLTFTRLLNTSGASGGAASLNPGSCPRPNTALDPAVLVGPRPLTNDFGPDAGCGDPGEYLYSVLGFDRAGNQSNGPIVRQFEYNPSGNEMVNAVNIKPFYAAGANWSWDLFATDDEDLSSASVKIRRTTSSGTEVRLIFGRKGGFFMGLMGTSWDGVLTTATPGTGTTLTLAAAFNLIGIADDGSALPGSSGVMSDGGTDGFGMYVTVFDTFGSESAEFGLSINPAFLTTASFTTGNPWSGGGVNNPAFTTIPGDATSCAWTYETPTNGATIITQLWGADETLGNGPNGEDDYEVIVNVVAQPILVSDNGITRVYRHNISNAGTCGTLGIDKIIGIMNNVGFIMP